MNVVVVVANLDEAEIYLHDTVNVVLSVNKAVLELELAVRAEGIGSGGEQAVRLASVYIERAGFYRTAAVNVVVVVANLDEACVCLQCTVLDISQCSIQCNYLRFVTDCLLNSIFIEQIERFCIGRILSAIYITCANISILIKSIDFAVDFLQLKSVD